MVSRASLRSVVVMLGGLVVVAGMPGCGGDDGPEADALANVHVDIVLQGTTVVQDLPLDQALNSVSDDIGFEPRLPSRVPFDLVVTSLGTEQRQMNGPASVRAHYDAPGSATGDSPTLIWDETRFEGHDMSNSNQQARELGIEIEGMELVALDGPGSSNYLLAGQGRMYLATFNGGQQPSDDEVITMFRSAFE